MFDTSLILSLSLYPSIISLTASIFGFLPFSWPYGYVVVYLVFPSCPFPSQSVAGTK